MSARLPMLCGALCVSAALALAPTAGSADTREQAIAAALADARGQGRVLGVTRERSADGRELWAVKIIVDGRVSVHRVPAD